MIGFDFFKDNESNKNFEKKISQIHKEYIKQNLYEDDNGWIEIIFSNLIKFKSITDIKYLAKKSEKEISRKVRNWLRKKECFSGIGFKVESECENENSEIIGYNDLKFIHSGWKNSFVIECKLLENSTSKINEYIHNKNKEDGGMYRFFINKYATNFPYGGMLGYIVKDDVKEIIAKIKERIRILEITSENDHKYGTSIYSDELFNSKILNQDLSFQSSHIRYDKTSKELTSPILLFHLFFDFTN